MKTRSSTWLSVLFAINYSHGFLIWWNTNVLHKKEVSIVLGSHMIFEKEQHKYNDKAKDYIGNQQKTQGLLNRAIKMANEKNKT